MQIRYEDSVMYEQITYEDSVMYEQITDEDSVMYETIERKTSGILGYETAYSEAVLQLYKGICCLPLTWYWSKWPINFYASDHNWQKTSLQHTVVLSPPQTWIWKYCVHTFLT